MDQSTEVQAADAYDELKSKILDPSVSSTVIADLLDGLASEVRPAAVRQLGPKEQRALYERSSGFASLELKDLVPESAAPLSEIRHLGRNTLPAFQIFEKRFCRLPEAAGGTGSVGIVAGYNFQKMAAVTGPGYFLAREDPENAEVLVDYGLLPATKPASWPKIRPNERGLSRFVYGFMVDRLRRVSEQVTIGSAARKGKEMGSYFVLSRAD